MVYGILSDKQKTLQAYLFKDNKNLKCIYLILLKKRLCTNYYKYTVLNINKKAKNYSILDIELLTGKNSSNSCSFSYILVTL